MRYNDFQDKFSDEAVVEAIRAAEKMTSGEIQVFITKTQPAKDAVFTEALRQFRSLGMHKTQHRNAVLVFVAPRSQEFAIVADEGIQEKCGAAPWRRATGQMREAFAKGDFTGGLVAAVTTIGQVLSREFPHQRNDKNELPDTIRRD